MSLLVRLAWVIVVIEYLLITYFSLRWGTLAWFFPPTLPRRRWWQRLDTILSLLIFVCAGIFWLLHDCSSSIACLQALLHPGPLPSSLTGKPAIIRLTMLLAWLAIILLAAWWHTRRIPLQKDAQGA
ncbi:MAG: hypothetical protein IRY86_14135 [Thermorudis peleae]|nr:hypothetical protein [Thermorudis peleae]